MASKDYSDVSAPDSEGSFQRSGPNPQAQSDALRLNEAAKQRLAAGDAAGAVGLLSRAAALDERAGELWFNLSAALRQLGRLQDALAAIERCVALSPRNLLAALEKGAVEEALGRHRAAAMTYRTVLQLLPPGARAPRELEAAVQHARRIADGVTRELETYVTQRLDKVRARHGNMSLARFDQCVDIILQKRPIFRQQPTFMFFPELPAIEFYPRELFPELLSLEAAAGDIRAELLNVLANNSDALEPYVASAKGAPPSNWSELTNSRKWSAYFFWNNGKAFDEHIARCPRTVEALRRWDMWDIPGNGPSAMFSILEPQTRIPAHTGTANTRLVVHLPLIIPPNCRFRVGGQRREWKSGEAFVFDDSIDHEAINDSNEARAVLIFTIWSPHLNEGERELVRELTDAIGDFYGIGEYYERRAGLVAQGA